MMPEDRYKITSNDYTDLTIIYNRNEKLLNRFPGATTHKINARYAVAYPPANILDANFISKYGYEALPHLYGLTSEISLGASGVSKLRRLPGFNLRGEGVMVALIDTGIDYTNPIFKHSDGTSKIVTIWDQTIDSENQYPSNAFYGTIYSAEQINQAINSGNPFDIVPSKDEIGHGTMLAGVLAGSEVPESEFSGVVPDADIIVIKLKQAKQNLRDFFIIPADVPCYQENDIQWAVQFIMDTVNQLKRPCAICIGLGTSQGSHDGRGPLDNTLNAFAFSPGLTFTISAGNEGDWKRHFYSAIEPSVGPSAMELIVGENEPGFSLELWGTGPNTYSIDILSPAGEYIPRIPESLNTNQEISFVLEKTRIYLNYRLVETHTGEQLILLRFRNPTPGSWKINVYSRGDLSGSLNAWLPVSGFISETTYFFNSNRFTTVTSPGNSITPLTITAYNPQNNELYNHGGRGYTRTGEIKPELTAPGVNVVVPTLNQGFTTATGTGIAAAHAAGINAIMLEWGIVRGFYPDMSTTVAKKYLIRGAVRNPRLQYPNQEWGYGIIDLYNVFNVLRADFPKTASGLNNINI